MNKKIFFGFLALLLVGVIIVFAADYQWPLGGTNARGHALYNVSQVNSSEAYIGNISLSNPPVACSTTNYFMTAYAGTNSTCAAVNESAFTKVNTKSNNVAGTNYTARYTDNVTITSGAMQDDGTFVELGDGTPVSGTLLTLSQNSASYALQRWARSGSTYLEYKTTGGSPATSNLNTQTINSIIFYHTGNATHEIGDVRMAQSLWVDENLTVDVNVLHVSSSNNRVGIGTVSPGATLGVSGEVNISGIGADGTGKSVCIKSDGNLGTCSNAVNATGQCTCG